MNDYGIDMNNSTSNYIPIRRMCRFTGQLCELATDFGYCEVTACVKNFELLIKNEDKNDSN